MFIRFSVVLVFLACGCGRAFNLSIKNETADTVTIDLTKDGPPFEENWASPEDIPNRERLTQNFASVYAGQTATVHDITGAFDAGTHAVLRVYRGDLIIYTMLKTKVGPDRQDLILTPGNIRLVVRDKNRQLTVEPAR